MNIYLVFLFIYLIVCIWVIKEYAKRELGVFQAPFIFTLASSLMMTPQFCTIIYNPYYDCDLLYDLSFIMITGTISFYRGFEKSSLKHIQSCYDIQLEKSTWMFVLMFIIGLLLTSKADSVASNFRLEDGGDIRGNHTFQILLFFRRYFDYGYFFALIYFSRKKQISKKLLIILIIGSLYYLQAVLFFARRALTVKLFMSLALLLSMIKPKWRTKLKWGVITFFSIGMIYNASIGDIRSNLSDKSSAVDIDYWENYKQSFYSPNMIHGMDLGNGALFIKYTKEHMNYNFGLFLWDDIVTWYFPSFIFGKEGKENLKVANANDRYIESVTHGVTTSTGYYDAFSAFSYFGFIMFYFMGYILGYIWNRAKVSSLYLILYLNLMYNIPNLASHGFSYIIGNIETFIVFAIPLLWNFMYKKKCLINKK